MPRKLKTYVTSVGFFDQAVAAPSMKAALEAWGAGPKAFKQGFAEETDDPAIVKAAMAKPGVVLRRAVGTNDAFTENAALPTSLPAGKAPARPKPKPKAKPPKVKKGKSAEVVSLAEARAAKQASAAYEKERARREKEEAKDEAARAKERERRDEAVEKAEGLLEKARKRHEAAMADIAAERDALDQREQIEAARWDKEKKKLEAGLRRAGE